MTIANTNTEYRDLPLSFLIESKTNPRRFFEDSALKELAAFVAGHKIGLLWPSPFCGRRRQREILVWRSASRWPHNG
jgi:hypothetical protein